MDWIQVYFYSHNFIFTINSRSYFKSHLQYFHFQFHHILTKYFTLNPHYLLIKFFVGAKMVSQAVIFFGCSCFYLFVLTTELNPSRTKLSTSFLNIPLCTFGTGYGLEHIVFEFYFNLKYTGSIFHVPSVPSKNSSYLCKNVIYSLLCSSFKWWHWFLSLYLNLTFCIFDIIL